MKEKRISRGEGHILWEESPYRKTLQKTGRIDKRRLLPSLVAFRGREREGILTRKGEVPEKTPFKSAKSDDFRGGGAPDFLRRRI